MVSLLKKLAVPFLLLAFMTCALAQWTNHPDPKAKTAADRPVSGIVTDADGKPVAGAVVQLKNTRTLQIRSFITREKGDYYFSGLSKDVDFELKAEFQGRSSASRTLSAFDTKTEPVLNLQIK